MRWARTALAFLVTTSAVPSARAGESARAPEDAGAGTAGGALPLELIWHAPPGCPDAPFVVRRVEEILQGPAPAPTKVVADATIRPVDGGRFELVLKLQTDDVEDTRTIDATSCASLAEASAVVIALAIDPSRGGSPVPAAPVPSSASPSTSALPPSSSAPPGSTNEPTPAPAAVRVADDAPARKPTPRSGPRVTFGLDGAVDVGTLPRASLGIVGQVALRWDRARVGVVGSLWLPQDATFDPASRAGASFDMVTAGAFASYMMPIARGPFAVGPRASMEATFVRVAGFGIRDPQASWSWWPTVVFGARGRARLSRPLALVAGADLPLPLGPPTFTLGSSGSAGSAVRLHEPAFLSARFTVGLEIDMP